MSASDRICRRSAARAAVRGLSIVELMIGIVVALLVGLAASTSAIVFTASQRQGIGAGGNAVGAANLLTELKHDAALAGLGFFGDNQPLCNRLNFSVDAVLVNDGTSFSPVRVTRDGVNDRIDIVYATQIQSGAHVLLRAASTGSGAELMSLLPAALNQTVLLAPAAPGDPCVVRTVTAVTASTDELPQQLAFAGTGKHNKVAFSTAPTYPERSRLLLLGDLRWHRYRVDNGNLLLERPTDGSSAVLARNVLAFRAQYGINDGTPGSTTVASWQDASGAGFATLDNATIGRVRALRIGLVTRSPQREKPDAQGNCSASEAKPELFGTVVDPGGTDWRCWRYRVTSAVMPMRNLVMGIK